ncbi:hypothetical protein LOD99_8235 [Oopsacas minuta]|uniref:FLYWCH-type domain-containing protein n=1 Tax=Oopsacas minuta TaxID=111878 RepID=A0AAV7JGU9_9METZ|nr:hypothetical protein LOD99_8235 [Oopsacas minuta]
MDPDQPSFRLIRTNKGGQKMLEGGYLYLMHRRVGEMTHWQCEQRGECKARVHTKGMEIMKRTNEHLHAPDVQATACCEIKAGIKRKARDTQDSSHHITGEKLKSITQVIGSNSMAVFDGRRNFNSLFTNFVFIILIFEFLFRFTPILCLTLPIKVETKILLYMEKV